MDKVYLQVHFASLIRTPNNLDEVDDTEYTLALLRSVTSFVKKYPAILNELYSVEGIRNAIMKLREARRNGKDDIMWIIYNNIDIEDGQGDYFYRNCKTFYSKMHLLEIAKMDCLIDQIYASAVSKLDQYVSFKNSMEEMGEQNEE